jgi:hypothetical protein
MADRKESAADITVSVGDEGEVVVERLSFTKEIEISTIYGSGRTLPDGYSIDQISYQGTMELQGNKLSLEDQLFDDNGIPQEATITITHFDGGSTSLDQVLATSEGWEMNAGETTTTTFEFMAMGKSHDGNPDREP